MKKWKDLEGIGGLLEAFRRTIACAEQSDESRKKMQFSADRTFVSTVFAADIQKWETAIGFIEHEDEWCTVQHYETEDEAKNGHDKWCKVADSLIICTDCESGDIFRRDKK